MEPPIGLEPITYCLQDSRSTWWAKAARFKLWGALELPYDSVAVRAAFPLSYTAGQFSLTLFHRCRDSNPVPAFYSAHYLICYSDPLSIWMCLLVINVHLNNNTPHTFDLGKISIQLRGSERDRTVDLPIFNRTLYQLSYRTLYVFSLCLNHSILIATCQAFLETF